MRGHPDIRIKLEQIAHAIPRWHNKLDHKDRVIWIACSSRADRLRLKKADRFWLIDSNSVIRDFEKLEKKYATEERNNDQRTHHPAAGC